MLLIFCTVANTVLLSNWNVTYRLGLSLVWQLTMVFMVMVKGLSVAADKRLSTAIADKVL